MIKYNLKHISILIILGYLRFGAPCISLENGMFLLTVFYTKDVLNDTDANMTWLGQKEPVAEVYETQDMCYYKGMNEDQYPYERKQSWWNVFAARLEFVLAFQVHLKHEHFGLGFVV